jgi:phosphoenolpyruvate synthase/pyruvate phosphate dikinase
MLEIAKLEKRIARLERQLKAKKSEWVKSPIITKLTGWDANKMRIARNNGYIQWKKNTTGFWYDLSSINEKFLNKKSTLPGASINNKNQKAKV